MTSLRQNIDDLPPERWAPLTRRAALAAVGAAERMKVTPPAALVAIAAMSEEQLLQHRSRFGPHSPPLSLKMQLVEAGRLRQEAQRRTQLYEEEARDAQAAAATAQGQAEESARVAAAAREQARTTREEAARRAAEHETERVAAREEAVRRAAEHEAERVATRAAHEAQLAAARETHEAERVADRQVLEELRDELDRVRADAAAAAASADAQIRAAEARADERLAERTAEKATAQQDAEVLRDENVRVRADAAAEVAAANEQVRAAQARAEERLVERAGERESAEQRVEELRGELERVRADAATEVAEARGQAAGRVAAAQQAAEAQVTRIGAEAEDAIGAAREWAQDEVARVRAELDESVRAQTAAATSGRQLLSVPVPGAEIRSRTRQVEDAVSAVSELALVLEAACPGEGGEAEGALDAAVVRDLVSRVEQHATGLSQQFRNLPSRYMREDHAQAATAYSSVAANAYLALLQRIAGAVHQLSQQLDDAAGEEAIAVVRGMLDNHPWRAR